MKYVYPAVFTNDPEGGYDISFPDIKSAYTHGDDLKDGYKMAEDVLCLALVMLEDEGAAVPEPSAPKPVENGFSALIGADTAEYRRITDSRAVKKTLSIPNWLNVAAEREGVNFSAVLQDALKARLGI